MRRLALVLALVALSLAQDCGPGKLRDFYARIREFSNSDDNPHKDDLDEHEDAINRLAARIGVIFTNADKAIHNAKDYLQVLDDLEAEVEGIEGTGCDQGEFNCHDGFGSCIDKILVCDGHDDCAAGYDESEAVCFNPFYEGSVWVGTFVWDHCTRRQPKEMRITISDTHAQNHLSSDMVLEADIFLESDHFNQHAEANFHLHGDYYFGNQRLIFQPPEDDRLGILIQYDGHHTKDATGWIIREASEEKCAEIIFHKQD